MPENLTEEHRLAYKPETAARMLDCSRQYIYKLLANGTLGSVKIGRSRRIPHAEIAALVGGERESA